MDGWERVKRGSKRCSTAKRSNLGNRDDSYCIKTYKNAKLALKVLDNLKLSIKHSKFFQEVLLQIETNNTRFNNEKNKFVLICYGLGGRGSESFLYQLALCVVLKDKFNISQDLTWLSDPIMDECDYSIIEACGLKADRRYQNYNESLIYPILAGATTLELFQHPLAITLDPNIKVTLQKDQTIFVLLIMPHCDGALYATVFEALSSIRSDVLSRTTFFGNDLRQYDNFQAANLRRDNPGMPEAVTEATLKLVHFQPLIEYNGPLPVFHKYPEAFSDQFICIFKRFTENAPIDGNIIT